MAEQTGPEKGKSPVDERQDRLKAALKANLARRKQQARARAADPKTEPSADHTNKDK